MGWHYWAMSLYWKFPYNFLNGEHPLLLLKCRLTLSFSASGAVHLTGNLPPSWGTWISSFLAKPKSEILAWPLLFSKMFLAAKSLYAQTVQSCYTIPYMYASYTCGTGSLYRKRTSLYNDHYLTQSELCMWGMGRVMQSTPKFKVQDAGAGTLSCHLPPFPKWASVCVHVCIVHYSIGYGTHLWTKPWELTYTIPSQTSLQKINSSEITAALFKTRQTSAFYNGSLITVGLQ